MLHGYKKSRYNIYDNLEFLGLNPYEQKHFCFGEGGSEGNGEGGLDVDSLSTDTPGLGAAEAEAAANAAEAAMSAAGLNAADSPEAAQTAMDAAAANAAGYDLGDYSNAVSQAAPSSNELDALEETGLIGYNDKAALGYLDTIERENRQSDINLARSISDKYGLTPRQVQPGFMQDPSLGPQTMSYRGPGSTNAAVSEIATAAGMLAANLVSMAPGPVGAALGALGFAPRDSFGGLVGQALGQNREDQSPSLSSRVQGYMDERAASQREANIAARGETDPSTAGIIDDYEEEVSQQGAFSAPNVADISVPNVAAPSSFDTVDLTGDVPFIPLAEPIPSVPTLAPEPAVEVVRAPVTRRPATDTFSILERIYGPDVAAKLLPTRIV